MFGSQKTLRIAELTARVERLIEQRDSARKQSRAAINSMSTIAGHADFDSRCYSAALSRYQQRMARLAYAVVRLRRELAAAQVRLAQYGDRRTVSDVLVEHDVHRKALADALGEQKYHLNWDQLIAEVDRLRSAAEAWMADHTTEKQRADRLQARLDQAVGLDSPDIALGAGWQTRRQDKTKGGAK